MLVPCVEGRWIESFLGSDIVAFNSGFKRAPLSDTNSHMTRFYRQIQQGIVYPYATRKDLEEEGERSRKAGHGGYDHFNYIRDRLIEVETRSISRFF